MQFLPLPSSNLWKHFMGIVLAFEVSLTFQILLFSEFFSLYSLFSSHEGHVLQVCWVHFNSYNHSKLTVLPLLKWTLYPNVKTASDVVLSFLARVFFFFFNFCPKSCCLPWMAHQSQLSPLKEGTSHKLPSIDAHLSFHDHGRSSRTKEQRDPKHVMVLLYDQKICQGF